MCAAFMIFAKISSVVTADRLDIWIQGLYYGFDRDFLVSSHLLIPQIEHLARILLQQEKIPTTTIDEYGVESEKKHKLAFTRTKNI